MVNPMFLIVGGSAVIAGAIANTAQASRTLAKVSQRTNLPRAISLLIIVAQVSELARTVEQTNVVNVIATLLLFTLWLATKSGTETEF